MKKKKPHPYKYLKFKGCFGSLPESIRGQQKLISPAETLGIYDETVFTKMSEAFNAVLNGPDMILDLKKVRRVTIKGGLLLKAFVDEFSLKFEKKPRIRSPSDKKIRAVLNYLGIRNYQDVKKAHYPDLECWQIMSWDHTQSDIEFGKLLATEVIPKCWKGDHAISEHSSSIATSVAEALFNCKEHAYTGEKENYPFKRWYLGVGEYPNTQRFSFCIYDKGIGIKARLRVNHIGWVDKISDIINSSDSSMIKRATEGKRVAVDDGRGQGLKSAIELLKKNNGQIDIYSDYGYFSSYDEKSGTDRNVRLEGTFVSFSFPVEYSKDSV